MKRALDVVGRIRSRYYAHVDCRCEMNGCVVLWVNFRIKKRK